MNCIRGMSFFQSQTKEFLKKLLVKEMKGIQRAPALLVPNIGNVDILNGYEILGNEPMHDIAEHWKNLLEEIPHHLPKEQKQLFQNISMIGLNKDSKRAVDYRKTAINLCIHLNGKIDNNIHEILLTGCNMQEILYACEEERNMTLILRYHLQSYIHTNLLMTLVGKTPKSLTGRKLFGKYFYSLSGHAGKQLRIVCKISHTEQEERQFNLLKSITKLTSNHHTNNVIFNIWVRLQAKKILDEKHCTFEKENSMIRKLNNLLPPKENSFISFEHINAKPDEWQALLETMIPDYLIDGVWWKENVMGIEFLDCGVNNLSKIRKHHYRSSTISQEEKYLKDMWEMCINNKMLIPAKIIKQEINVVVIYSLTSMD